MYYLNKTLCNMATNKINQNCEVNITINDHSFISNIIFATSISDSIKNIFILDSSKHEFTFKCDVKDDNTYKLLESVFQGAPDQSLIKDQVIQDIFQIGQVLKSDDMVSWFAQRYNGQTIEMSTLDDRLIYSKQIGFSQQLIDFVATNLTSIAITKCLNIFKDFGFDFADSVFRICQQKGMNFNNYVISLIESDITFMNLINYVNYNYLVSEQNIRVAQILSKSLRSLNDIHNSVLDYYIGGVLERQVSEIRNLKNELNNLRNNYDSLLRTKSRR